ncbi:MAG: exodeoxyribonuclease III [Thermosynechococcaceae cyanobacterium MS004]|nr:exodeoxyribonuclease III [Thermosynechococcaceae cyanobacterium MS004]
MKIATWNVNSIRSRLTHALDWLEVSGVDVLCLQETKVVDADFPRSPFEAAGYHLYTFGQKSYNGVALVSRQPLTQVICGFSPVFEAAGSLTEAIQAFDEQKRVISAVAAGVRLVNLYVPNGSSIGSEKYDYKLRWFGVLRQYLELLKAEGRPIAMCGDFNIALEDRDIHNPEGKEAHIMASPLERETLRGILDLGFADAFRKFTQEAGHYSWWDYRTAAFRRDMGWRIDHHYLTPDLYEQAIACTIDKAPRSLPQPSDHTPVIVELDLER